MCNLTLDPTSILNCGYACMRRQSLRCTYLRRVSRNSQETVGARGKGREEEEESLSRFCQYEVEALLHWLSKEDLVTLTSCIDRARQMWWFSFNPWEDPKIMLLIRSTTMTNCKFPLLSPICSTTCMLNGSNCYRNSVGPALVSTLCQRCLPRWSAAHVSGKVSWCATEVWEKADDKLFCSIVHDKTLLLISNGELWQFILSCSVLYLLKGLTFSAG